MFLCPPIPAVGGYRRAMVSIFVLLNRVMAYGQNYILIGQKSKKVYPHRPFYIYTRGPSLRLGNLRWYIYKKAGGVPEGFWGVFLGDGWNTSVFQPSPPVVGRSHTPPRGPSTLINPLYKKRVGARCPTQNKKYPLYCLGQFYT